LTVFGGDPVFKYDPLFTRPLFLSCLILIWACHELVTLVKLLGDPKHKRDGCFLFFIKFCFWFLVWVFFFFCLCSSTKLFIGKLLVVEGFVVGVGCNYPVHREVPQAWLPRGDIGARFGKCVSCPQGISEGTGSLCEGKWTWPLVLTSLITCTCEQ